MISLVISVYISLFVLSFTDAMPSGECHLQTSVYKTGDEFTLPDMGPCLKFKCMQGAVIPIETKCETPQGNCIDKGAKFTDPSDCFVLECDSTFELTHVQLLCRDDAGKCYNDGETVVKNQEGNRINCTCSSNGFDANLNCP